LPRLATLPRQHNVHFLSKCNNRNPKEARLVLPAVGNKLSKSNNNSSKVVADSVVVHKTQRRRTVS
jgi:hypothetical protein